ncbi:MAG: hypothetical protein ABSA57_11710 [Candidatus Acidiferrales bacterium]|jgi:hypothetical protein
MAENFKAMATTQLASGPFLKWEGLNRSIVVLLHGKTAQLLATAIAGNRQMPSGILLGKLNRGDHLTVTIEGHQPIPRAVWKTTDSPFGDRRQLAALLHRWQSKSGRETVVVGFYRSCTDGEKTLNEDDLSVPKISPTCTESVFLLMEPHHAQPINGRLFLIKEGVVAWKWDSIPFDRPHLPRERTVGQAQMHARPDVERERTLEANTGPRPEPGQENTLELRWIARLALIALSLAIALLLWRGLRTPRRSELETSSAVNARLGLKLERMGSDWRLSWNSYAPIFVKKDLRGKLLIVDGHQRKIVELDSSDLRGGMIVYSSRTNDMAMQLQIYSDDWREPVSESVKVTGPFPPSAPPAAPLPGSRADGNESETSARSTDSTQDRENDAGAHGLMAPDRVDASASR